MQLFSYQQGGITLIQARLTLDQNHFFKTKYKRILNYYYYTKIFKAIAKYKTSTIFFTAVHQFKIKRPQCIAVCQVILDLRKYLSTFNRPSPSWFQTSTSTPGWSCGRRLWTCSPLCMTPAPAYQMGPHL